MKDITIEATNLVVNYGKKQALNLEKLQINSSEGIVGLFGPNGAGKSTLMRTVVGDITSYKGILKSPDREEISYLPDAPFLYSWLKVKQCMELFISRYKDFRVSVFESFIKGSNIELESYIGELSKGMSERVHLALIMSRAPKLYVLDEPLSGVDPLSREHLLNLIQELRIKEVPLLLSTHLINGVDTIFDEVILIADGRLIAHDSADNLRLLGDGNLENAYKRSIRGNE